MEQNTGPVNGANFTISYISGNRYIKCHTCGMTSFAPGDIDNRYCGNCHKFHSDLPVLQAAEEVGPQKGSKT